MIVTFNAKLPDDAEVRGIFVVYRLGNRLAGEIMPAVREGACVVESLKLVEDIKYLISTLVLDDGPGGTKH